MKESEKSKSTPNIHRHNPPKWFRKSDFGIFIHWGLYSVPAYAPVDTEDFASILQNESPEYLFANQPYSEWYKNSILIKDSPAYKYHKEHYGDMAYEEFAKTFKQSAKNVDVEDWASLFSDAGAKYVVLVTKHHDGFVMYNTNHPNPRLGNYCLDFDFVGDLARACRSKGMRFGVYYSSLLDWTFTDKPVTRVSELFLGNNNSREYMDYSRSHWLELIDRYQPDILWSDIGYPADSRLEDLFRYYYDKVPEGLVNDRWSQFPNWLRNPLGKKLLDRVAAKWLAAGGDFDVKYYDYRTIEYTSEWKESDVWFEMCRGMDKSFAYNKFSNPQDFITAQEVKDIIADIHPKKGRLLLNVGPDENGVIPEYQRQILTELRSDRNE